MTRDELSQRLAQISLEIEGHTAATWRLEDERLTLRQQLRALDYQPASPQPAQVSA